MKTHWFYILTSLASSDRYGSAIQEDVRSLSEGNVRLWPVTLYGSLEELTQRCWIRELGAGEVETAGHGRERFYRITEAGREALRGEAEKMAAVADRARARLLEGSARA